MLESLATQTDGDIIETGDWHASNQKIAFDFNSGEYWTAPHFK